MKQGDPAHFTTASDMFSAGTVFYELIFKQRLFYDKDPKKLLLKNMEFNFNKVFKKNVREKMNA